MASLIPFAAYSTTRGWRANAAVRAARRAPPTPMSASQRHTSRAAPAMQSADTKSATKPLPVAACSAHLSGTSGSRARIGSGLHTNPTAARCGSRLNRMRCAIATRE